MSKQIQDAYIVAATRLPNTAPASAVLDSHQGFGRVDLARVVKPPAGTKLWLSQSS